MRDRSAGSERARGLLDVLRRGARQRRDDRAPHLARNLPHRFGVGRRRDGEAGLDDVHAERVERARHGAAWPGTSSEKPGACSPSRSVVSKMMTRAESWAHDARVVAGRRVEVKVIIITDKISML